MNKLYRTTAWVKPLRVNLENIVNNRKETISLKSFLKTSELRQRKNYCIKIKKWQLNASVVKESLLRCEGRIQHAPLPCDSKTIILLNDKHKLS